MLKLDFSIESAQARADYVNRYMDQAAYYTQKELDTISNYLLYGKDEDGTSSVDRKEINIKPKHSSYSKKEAESLDALMEKPTFDERCIKDNGIRYKTVKPTISRVDDADVPGMKELWGIIDDVAHVVDVNKGKEEDAAVRQLTSGELYEMQHYLIELRRQQFYLRDSVKPTICRTKTNIRSVYEKYEEGVILWDDKESDYSIAPLGLYRKGDKRFEDVRNLEEKDYHYNENAKWVLDFREPLHIYYLYENWESLETEEYLDAESTAGPLMRTLEFYRARANLTDEQELILELKKQKWNNQSISDEVKRQFGSTHSANYISTIYKQKICGRIAEAATLHFDYYMNRDVPTAWKKCSCCGEYKLKDTREYMRRARSSDGLAPVCKVCEKKKRGEKK